MKTIAYYGTIGPSCGETAILKQMAAEGMTGIRMNLSHGRLTAHRDWIEKIQEAGIPELLIDLQGPELRIGEVKPGTRLTAGQLVMLKERQSAEAAMEAKADKDTEAAMETEAAEVAEAATEAKAEMAAGVGQDRGGKLTIPVPAAVLKAVGIGQTLLIDDGRLSLQVVGESDRICRVLRGGPLLSRKSLTVPGLEIPSPTLTEEDHENLRLAASFGVTGVMLPFVRNRQDIRNLKQALQEYHAGSVRIFAKIENLEGVRALPSLVSQVDQVVIARGDLGNAMPLWELPGCQKRLARICQEAGTPFMVVTQMLDSMQERAVPTRAEVCDIYNAVMDGAASVMLTGETAVGRYPVEAMRYLVRTARCACRDLENIR